MDKPSGNQHGKMWFLVLLMGSATTSLPPLSMKKDCPCWFPRISIGLIECLLLVYAGNITWIIP